MLNSITWGQYVAVLVTLLICFYIFIGAKYFRWEILSLIGIKRIDEKREAIPLAEIKKHFDTSNHSDFLPKENMDEEAVILQPYWDEVNAYLGEIKHEDSNEEILLALKRISEKYPDLDNPAYRQDVDSALSGLLNQYFPQRFKTSDIQHIR